MHESVSCIICHLPAFVLWALENYASELVVALHLCFKSRVYFCAASLSKLHGKYVAHCFFILTARVHLDTMTTWLVFACVY